ncbi:cytochrome c class I [Pontibacter sp. Tf4]|uniref:c-type cytochrome n=1 Tax=Pontibacter sp. Tf4 TaxID=2761620 RepID=UPI001628A4ED|nr:c-type cytochrome [Pontibacter sp. Tf4]MBB6611877.1 cytochrome c class I [Pontibacter sp. Tf4]
MKKLLFTVTCCAVLAACGSDKKSEYDRYYEQDYRDSVATAMKNAPQTKTGATAATNEMTDSAATAPAEPKNQYEEVATALMAKSDCLACHKVEQKVVGPSYNDVAAKYEFNDKNVDYLAEKIIKGGSGVWGEIPMPPHADMKKEDAQNIARYVLSLNK